jgi:transcriptional regulator with XRE-family HTH domain
VNRLGNAVVLRFGENIWWLRTQHRFSQAALADRAGIHRTQVSMIELGRRTLTLPTFVALAATLEVSSDRLLEGFSYWPAIRGPGGFLVEPLKLPGVA